MTTSPDTTDPPAPKRRPGRPSKYSARIATAICEAVASGQSLREVCRDLGAVDERTVRSWAVDDVEGFGAMFTRARQIQAMGWADMLLGIVEAEPLRGEDGRVDHGAVQHQRLRADTIKWLLCKMLPKAFGDRVDVAHAGRVEVTMSPEERERRIEEVLHRIAERTQTQPEQIGLAEESDGAP